jgi:thiamine-phosphate pyrophosphorylase
LSAKRRDRDLTAPAVLSGYASGQRSCPPFAGELEHALGAGDVAAVPLLADGGDRALIERTKHIAAVVQPRDVALVVDNRPEIVARAGADGAHLSGVAKFAAALSLLKSGTD